MLIILEIGNVFEIYFVYKKLGYPIQLIRSNLDMENKKPTDINLSVLIIL